MQITQSLQRLEGEDRDAMHVVIPLVYEELKKLARSHLRREARSSALQTTALVHEAYLKLSGSRHPCYEIAFLWNRFQDDAANSADTARQGSLRAAPHEKRRSRTCPTGTTAGSNLVGDERRVATARRDRP
jgi:hypothetical protein